MTARERALALVEQAHADLPVLIDQHFMTMIAGSGLAEATIAETLAWAAEHNRAIWERYNADVINWLSAEG